jgi:hypothetical protein
MSRLLALATVFFCFEIGLFLILIPWSELWTGNYLLSYVPRLRPFILDNTFRSAVTALGVIDLLIGLIELRYFIRSFRIPNRIGE